MHRRFSDTQALTTVRKRYDGLRPLISAQVKALQKDESFLSVCEGYYAAGLKDWQILSAINNVMMHQRAQELNINLYTEEGVQRYQRLSDELPRLAYPSKVFERKLMEMMFTNHNLAVLRTYGFEPRRAEVDDKAIEAFLRERMRHFEFDLDHLPIFGRPPGDWPAS